MALTEALRFLITSDSAQARGDLAKLNQQTATTMSGLDKLKGTFAAGLGVGAGVGIADAALNGLGQVGRFALGQAQQAVNAASNLQQAQGAVNAIFGESSAIVQQYGREAADAVGLSNAAYQQQAATLGALLQNLGQTRAESAQTSQSLIQTGADLAATFGTTTADAVAAIGSALRGERDPIERYGISIKEAAVDQKALEMGLAATASELTNAQKATATLALIQQQAASSAGAFGRESDTLAGQQQRLNAEMENLRAEVGQALLPAMTELVSITRSALPVITDLAGNIVSAAQAAKDAASPILDVAYSVKDLWDNAAGLAGLPGLGDLLGGRGGGELAKKAQAWNQFINDIRDGNIPIDEAKKSLDGLPPSVRQAAEAAIALAKAHEESSRKADTLSMSLDTMKKVASSLGSTMFGADKAESAFFKTMESDGSTAGRTAKQIEKAYRTIDDASRSLVDAQAALQEAEVQRFLTSLGASSDDITLAQIAERESTRSLTGAKRDLADAQERLRKLREGDAATLLDAEAANIEAQRALVEAEKSGDAVALKRAKADLLRTEEALQKARDPASAEDLAQAEDDVAAAQDAVTKAEIAAKTSRQELNDLINRGRDGSRELADANKAVEKAQRDVESAEYALADATDALTGPVSGLAGATKSANDRFLEGEAAAETWLKKLIDGKATPEEFAEAVRKIRERLGEVAAQAGKTKELDDYLAKMESIYGKITDIDRAASGASVKLASIPGFVGSSGSIGVGGGGTTVQLNVDGKKFGEVVVGALLGWSNDNGALPIKVR